MTFHEWRDSNPPEMWAKFDLSAARVGWDAALKQPGVVELSTMTDEQKEEFANGLLREIARK